MTSVLLCSDEPILAQGLTAILSRADNFELVSFCPKAGELREQLDLHHPDILLVDLTADFTFGLLRGLNLVERTKTILWVHSISTDLAVQAMSLGVRGVLRKAGPIEALVRCFVRVNDGEMWFEKELTDSIMSASHCSLTARERQLIILLVQGLKNKELATALSISEGTVKVYLSRLFQKVGVKGRFELALYGLKNLAGGIEAMEVTTAVSPQNAASSAEQRPRSLLVERIPPQSVHDEHHPLVQFRP